MSTSNFLKSYLRNVVISFIMDLNLFLDDLFKKNTCIGKEKVFEKKILEEMEKDILFFASEKSKQFQTSKEKTQNNLLNLMKHLSNS